MRLINADALKRRAITVRFFGKDIMMVPTIDAVSCKDTVTLNSPISIQADMVAVVRCKDCRWQKISRKSGLVNCGHKLGMIRADDNNFCSYGERREP